MSVFDDYNEKLKNIFSPWIQVVDKQNSYTLESFPYDTGVIKEIVHPHCEECTAVNKCYFKNEPNKKPEGFDYSKVKIGESKKGTYHPNCHCEEKGIKTPSPDDIRLIIPEGKIWWLFNDKREWVHKFGYVNEDEYKIVNEIKEATIKAYVKGSYKFNNLDAKGYKITVFIEIFGINHAQGQVFKLKNGFTVFPNGKLKNNTLLGGWQK